MTTEITEYSPTETALAALRDQYAGKTFEVATPAGMKLAIAARAELRDYRVNLEKMRKQIKEPALRRCQLIDTEARRITTELVALEDPIDAQIKAEEKRREDEKAAKLEAERRRLANHRERIDAIKRYQTQAVGLPAGRIHVLIEQLRDGITVDASFEEFEAEAAAAKAETLEALVELHTRQLEQEAEQRRIAEERAELERYRKQEQERLAAERAAEEERLAAARAVEEAARAERDRIEAEARAAREQAELEERRRRREQEEAERQAREAAEAEARAAEAEARAAEDARLAAERERIRQEEADAAAARRAEEQRLADEQARLQRERAELEAQRIRDQLANVTLTDAATSALALLERIAPTHIETHMLAAALGRELQKQAA